MLIADLLDGEFVSPFDGASTYKITGQTRHKTAADPRLNDPKMAAAAAPGKISTMTEIPGYEGVGGGGRLFLGILQHVVEHFRRAQIGGGPFVLDWPFLNRVCAGGSPRLPRNRVVSLH